MGAWDRLEGVRGRLRAVRDRLSPLVAPAWRWVREEPMVGIGISVALHILIIALIIHFGGPGSAYKTKRGEPLFVELPEIKEPAARGLPGPPPAPTPPPAPKAEPKPPAARPQPPAPARARPAEPPRVAAAPTPEPPRERPSPPIEKSVAPAEKPAPKPPEPPPADAKNAMPVPVAPARPTPAPAAPAPAPSASSPAPSPAPGPPAGAPTGPSRPSGPQVAAIPPGPREPVFDLKSLGRGSGGAGGRGEGRGGIEGEPVPLDSPDPKYSDYLDRVRRMIRDKWGFPCAEGAPDGYRCVRREGEMIIEFGIAKDGHVPFITLRQSTGSANMDSFALNAIKLAQPFPPVPDVISKTGFPILARFRYILVDQSLTNVLR